VVHAHFGWAAAEARRAAVDARVPLVVTFHGSDLTVYPGLRRAWDYRKLLADAADVIVVSEFLAAGLPRYGFDRRPHVIPMGIDLERLPFRRVRTDAALPRVLFVGRLVESKGVDVLLKAIPLVRVAVPEARFEIVGDGPLRGSWEAMSRALRLEGTVRFRGALPRASVHEELARADIVAVPSRGVRSGGAEARSVLAMEAMAVGTPLVATDNGGLPETVPPEHRCDLAREGDPESLAAALVERLTHPETWPERAAVARRWVERTFAWPVIADEIARVYATAVGR
jgi:colanic acid/amylovoran biosynthesis glycosyltransferase